MRERGDCEAMPWSRGIALRRLDHRIGEIPCVSGFRGALLHCRRRSIPSIGGIFLAAEKTLMTERLLFPPPTEDPAAGRSLAEPAGSSVQAALPGPVASCRGSYAADWQHSFQEVPVERSHKFLGFTSFIVVGSRVAPKHTAKDI